MNNAFSVERKLRQDARFPYNTYSYMYRPNLAGHRHWMTKDEYLKWHEEYFFENLA